MKRVVATVAAALVLSPLAASLSVAAPAHAPAQVDPSAEIFSRVCTTCHPSDRIVATRRSRDQWQEVMDNMQTRGLKATDEELVAVMSFLVSHHGRVNVNRALPDEMADVLAVAVADAQKIVDYRKAHGPFEDLDALAKVPGIDVDKLKAQREAIGF